jgi:hypothetical protein
VISAAPAGAKNAPFPPPAAGKGTEPTAGSGVGGGISFRPRDAIATYDGVHYVIYLTTKPLSCAKTYLAKAPYLTISIVTGSPLVVGALSLQKGDSDFVQVDFYVSATRYYLVQPGVRLTLTRVTAARNADWHGRVSVPVTDFEGKTFSFTGSFAAPWCGRVP